jgi:Protein of unknown function (DUF2953)
MLSLLLAIVLIVVPVIVIIILTFLLVPFTLNLAGSVSLATPPKFDLSLTWIGLTLWRSKRGKPEPRVKPPKKKRNQVDVRRIAGMLSTFRDSLPALRKLIKYVRRAVHIDYMGLDLSFGSGDPAETAIIAGYLWSLAWLLNEIPNVNFSLRPDLQNVELQAAFRAKVKVTMLFLVVGFLSAYTKKPFRQLIREARASRSSENK